MGGTRTREVPLFGKDNLPIDHDEALGGNAWAFFRKLTLTKALRIEGPFKVLTIHGGEPQLCEDGYLAIDSQGHPYPIDLKVFEETFEAPNLPSQERLFYGALSDALAIIRGESKPESTQPAGHVSPTLGRIVWYCEPPPKPGELAIDRAAMVLEAGDGEHCGLWIFAPDGGYYKASVFHVERAPGEQAKIYSWRWPERVG